MELADLQSKPTKKHIYYFVVGVTFITLLISAGVRSAPGVLIIPLEQYFGWNRAVVTFPLAINLALYGVCGPFAAALMERYGVKPVMLLALLMLAVGTGLSSLMQFAWQMTLLWGVLVGIGTGLTSSVLGAVVAEIWFHQGRGLTVGLFTASGAAGQLIFLPLFAKIASAADWQAVVWVTAIVSFLTFLLVLALMHNKPSDVGMLAYGARGAEIPSETIAQAKANPLFSALVGIKIALPSIDFWLLAASFFICGLSTNGLMGTHFIPAAIEHGVPEVEAASLLAVIGIFNVIGTLVSGWLTDRLDSRWLLFWYYGLRGLALLFFPHALGQSYLNLIIFIVFYGLDWIATVPPTVRLTGIAFGKHSGVVFGWIFAFHQLGAATAAAGGGALRALAGNYHLTFLLAGLFCLLASGLVIKIPKRSGQSC